MIPSQSALADTPEPTPTSSAPTSRSSSLSRPGRPKNLNLNLNPPLTLDEYALLPLCGVFAYRAVRTLAYAFGKPSTVDPSSSGKHINEHEDGARRRALVLRGHDGVGAMAVQMLVRRGWRVCVHVSLVDPDLVEGSREERQYMDDVEKRVRRWGGEEVIFDDGCLDGPTEGSEDAVVRVIERLVGDGDVFDAVLDTVGGKEIWEASERLLRNTGVSAPDRVSLSSPLKRGMSLRKKKKDGANANSAVQGNPSHGTGQFTTLVGDYPSRPIPTAGDHFKAGLRSLKNTHSTTTTTGTAQDGVGKVGYAWVSIAQDVDWEGEDVRDSLSAVVKMAMNEGVRPWVPMGNDGDGDGVGRIVPFERTPHIFVADGPLCNGGTAVVKLVE